MSFNCKYCKVKKKWRILERNGNDVRLVRLARNESEASVICKQLNEQEANPWRSK